MIEHKCTSRGCGKITVYENTAQHCFECGRAVIETYTGDHNPVRQAKQGLLARARALFDKKVDRELDEVLPRCGFNTVAEDAPAALDAQCGKGIAPTSAFDRQEGGSHYADFEIQPSEFILVNGLGFVEGNVIKYVCRHRNKNGAQDLRKAIHYIEMLLETEYGEARHGNR